MLKMCLHIYYFSSFCGKSILDRYFVEDPLEKVKLCKPLIDINSDKPVDCVGEKRNAG